MTLIARVPFRNVPILVGDLLTTSDHGLDKFRRIKLAGLEDPNQKLRELGSPFYVHGLVQKINKLSENFYIAVAGEETQIRTLLQKLELIAHDADLSSEKVRGMINSIDYKDRSTAQAIGMFTKHNMLTGGTDFWCFDYKVRTFTSDYFGVVSIAGSGYRPFVVLLDEIANTAKNLEEDITAAQELGYLLQSFMSGFDIIDGRNLLSRWGGGLEIVTFDVENCRFTKQDNITHIFVLGNLKGSSIKLKLIPKIVYHCYVDDVLMQHVIEYTESKKRELAVLRNDLLYAKPIMRGDEVNIAELSCRVKNNESRHLFCHVVLRGFKNLYMHTHSFHNVVGEPMFSYSISESGKLTYDLCPTVFDAVRKALR